MSAGSGRFFSKISPARVFGLPVIPHRSLPVPTFATSLKTLFACLNRFRAVARVLNTWRVVRAPAAHPWLAVLMAGLVVTLVLVIRVRQLEDQAAQASLASEAEARLTLLEANLARAVDGVVAVANLFDQRKEVTRAEFARSAHAILMRQPLIRALEWVPLIHPDDVPVLQARAAADGFAGFALTEADPVHVGQLRPITPRAEYFPVWFVEPRLSNERASGFDLGSTPVSLQVLQAARTSGELQLSGPIQLVQEPSAAPGVLFARPVYALPTQMTHSAGDGLTGSVPVNPSALRGFVLAVLRVDRLVEAVQPQRQTLAVRLFDAQSPDGLQRLYPPGVAGEVPVTVPHGFRVERHFELGGRNWLAVVQAPEGHLRAGRTASRVTLLAGLLISLLLARLQFQSLYRARAIRDVVDRRTRELLASERRLIQLNQEASQSARARTVFLASMTHEFRTPMNAVLGLLAGLRRSPLSEAQQGQVDKASGAAHRLLRLVEDILDLSRIEAGRLVVERHPFFIETVLHDVLVASVPRLGDKPVELVCDLDPQTPAVLIGDGMLLTQVLVNLTENACKFTLRGDVVLKIECLRTLERRVDLRFSVRDTGPGLSGRDVDRLFEPFSQAEQLQASEFGGSGLGLAIVRQLVELLGGEITVDSRLGQGTCFQFDLSLAISDATPVIPVLQRSQPLRVLLIESHHGAAASLQRMLHAAGALVRHVALADDLGPALEEAPFALAILAQGFAGLPQVHARLAAMPGLRVVLLGRPGLSLHLVGAQQIPEKPLLPGGVLAMLRVAPEGATGTQDDRAAPENGA